jgi:hypothetical protein
MWKYQAIENLKSAISSTDFKRSKQLKNVEYFHSQGNVITNDVHEKLNPVFP